MTPIVNNSQFGDTTYTKVFVGGLAWETRKDTMKQYFDQFGDILEAVVISDKSTGRSKGYGFVTFCDAESAMKACVDPAPVIDGRRANCNLAAFSAQKSKPFSPKNDNNQGVVVVDQGISMKGGVRVGMGAAFPCASNFPHYAIQHGSIPYNVVGYSQDHYAYPSSNYYGIYGQYPLIYGTAGTNVAGMMMSSASAAPYYPYVQYPSTRGSYGHYAIYHPHHQQQQHHHHLVQYSAMNYSGGSYHGYQPYAYCPQISMTSSGLNMMILPAPIVHR